MRVEHQSSRFSVTSAIFNVLDPIPFGLFVAVLIFDIAYTNTFNVLWMKCAAWLVALGLIFAIVPQLINLARVWFRKIPIRTRIQTMNFWLNVVGIVAALINAFVHSRDAYAVMPAALWLSIVTVLALGLGRVLLASEQVTYTELNHGKA
jgi:uncharacterized membrane protein